jgi:hypothetical protein
MQDPILKITSTKGVAEAVEHLPSKCKALSSKPRTTHKKVLSIIIMLSSNPTSGMFTKKIKAVCQ